MDWPKERKGDKSKLSPLYKFEANETKETKITEETKEANVIDGTV